MAWIKNYPISKSKTDLKNLTFTVTGEEPNYLGRGLSEIKLHCVEDNKTYLVIVTRKDVEIMRSGYPQHFKFVEDPKNSEWANVELIKDA